jgi:hypothetical protein
VPHLDWKHTVFGKVVSSLEILDKLEAIPTNHDEKPEQDIKINKLIIFVDPFDVLFFEDNWLIYRNGKRNGGTKKPMTRKRGKIPRGSRKMM